MKYLRFYLFAGLAGLFSSPLHAQTTNTFNFSRSIVQWTVPYTAYYDIMAYGAQGARYEQTSWDPTYYGVIA